MRYIINEDDDLSSWEESQEQNDIKEIKNNKRFLDEILPIALKYFKKKYEGVLENIDVSTIEKHYRTLDFTINGYELSFEFNVKIKDEHEYYNEIIEDMRWIFGINYNEYTMPLNVYTQQSD